MASYKITLDDLRAALKLTDFDAAAAQQAMIPTTRLRYPMQSPDARPAGVLILLYPQDGELHFVLTRRTSHLHQHSGQISFPGGKCDPTDRDVIETALRETCEELGICDQPVTILGQLATIYIPPSNFEVYPTVAAMPIGPIFQPSPDEVDAVFSVPVSALLADEFKQAEESLFMEEMVTVPFYGFEGQKVWGATATILSELEGRLRSVLPADALESLR